MTFQKWPKIQNSYQQKFIDVFLAEFPELAEETFVITEKLHGSCLQIFFQPNQPWQVGKRTAFLADGEKFFGVRDVLPEYELFFEYIQATVNVSGVSIRLFGELVGPGIQKGVNYGPRKKPFFFGYMINDVLQPWQRFRGFADAHDFSHLLVPVISEFDSLEATLAVDTGFNSKLTSPDYEGENVAEGVVIQPLCRVYVNNGGKTFLLKKKNEKFLEKSKAKHPPSPGDPEIMRLSAEFKLYITENRLQGIFSKHGEIAEPAQIGDYIRLMLEDAKEDFSADHGDALAKLEKGEQRKVFNVGGMIAHMLKGYL